MTGVTTACLRASCQAERAVGWPRLGLLNFALPLLADLLTQEHYYATTIETGRGIYRKTQHHPFSLRREVPDLFANDKPISMTTWAAELWCDAHLHKRCEV